MGRSCKDGDVMKPCPFCGSTKTRYDSVDLCAWVTCQECGAIAPKVFSNDAKIREVQAEAMWNERK